MKPRHEWATATLLGWTMAGGMMADAAVDAAPAAPSTPAEPATAYQPLAFLVGHCWKGTFPDGRSTDEHCFSWIYGGKFVRDEHVVHRTGQPDGFGESIYLWDAGAGQHVQAHLHRLARHDLAPLGPGLGMVTDWTLGQFVSTLRTGIDPNGHELAKEMPWQPIGRMDDDELGAIYAYLIQLPDFQSSAIRCATCRAG